MNSLEININCVLKNYVSLSDNVGIPRALNAALHFCFQFKLPTFRFVIQYHICLLSRQELNTNFSFIIFTLSYINIFVFCSIFFVFLDLFCVLFDFFFYLVFWIFFFCFSLYIDFCYLNLQSFQVTLLEFCHSLALQA